MLFWHDYETSGLSPIHDQAYQFAGIRTDDDLNILGKPVKIYNKPHEDKLPSPDAVLVTGITPQIAEEQGMLEKDFFKIVHDELARSGTCGVGYNSIRFDDEFTRYGLYRNFYDPYEREYQGGNSRWDIIDMLRLCRVIHPEGINWCDRDDGKPTFRLELLASANGIEHANAHDAMSDVYATIDLARLVKRLHPEFYAHCYSLRFKRNVHKLVSKPFLIANSFNSTGVKLMPLMYHPINKNAIICWDIDKDPDELGELSFKDFHLIKCNQSPMLVPTEGRNPKMEKLLDSFKFVSEVNKLYCGGKDYSKVTDPEELMYAQFTKNRFQLHQARYLKPDEWGDLKFFDYRLPELFFRYRARNYSETLTADERNKWSQFCYDKITAKLPDFYSRIKELTQANPEKVELLQSIIDYKQSLKFNRI